MEQMKLNADEIKSRTEQLVGWQHQFTKIPESLENTDTLFKMYPFSDFKSAIEFINKIAEVTEKLNHYPTIMFSSEYINVMAWTPELNGVTEKDFELAKGIDEVSDKQ